MSEADHGDDGERVRLVADETADLLAWHADVVARNDSEFEAAKELSTRLGAHPVGYVDGGRADGQDGDRDGERRGRDTAVDPAVAEVGFWTPELVEAGVDPADVYLDVLTPTESVDLPAEETSATFRRERVPLERKGEYYWGVIEGMRAGTRDRLGSLYRLVYRAEDDGEGGGETWCEVPDPLAHSLPFGAFAPAEYYDVARLHRERDDRAYFESLGTDDERVTTTEDDGLPRVDPAVSVLELHPGTATEAESLGGLARRYEEIGRKLREGEELAPAERNFAGYDAVQVMPVEPVTQNAETQSYWDPDGPILEDAGADDAADTDDGGPTEVSVTVGRPDTINWGYDIVLSGFSAVNPAILETGRPDELADFIAACHGMPRPVRVVFDVALGHADERATELLNDRYFSGPGMYGQNLDYQHPTVRAILLEMQRRKMDFGADGIRVDGAQDFTYWNPETEEEVHDDAFLAEMDAVTQEVAGREYRPWMIFEDGRPWPREDWELASTYRALIEQHPHAFQWSPVTFAHNTPALLTFWATKWWRVREVADLGGHWLTGVANHDTVRRGTQIDPTVEFNQSPVNPYLGELLPDTLDAAYDNPAASTLFYAMLPGVPMDFVTANFRAPWGFVRDTDPDWNVKVVADEAHFLDWQVRPETFARPEHFARLKALGFESVEGLREFVVALSAAVDATDYDREAMARMLDVTDPPLADDGERLSAADLDAFGYAWMRDVHEFANLSHWADTQDDDRTAFELSVREFRHDRPWLRDDLSDAEHFDYRHPADGTVFYYGLRESPAGDERLLFAANMEGVTVDASPASVVDRMRADPGAPEVSTDGWTVALAAPGVEATDDGAMGGDADSESGDADGDDTVTLDNAQAVVWRRDPRGQ